MLVGSLEELGASPSEIAASPRVSALGWEHFGELVAPISHSLGFAATQEWIDRMRSIPEFSELHGAAVANEIVGGAVSYDLDLTIPGGKLPARGLAMVGVQATHTRRGLMRMLVDEHFRAAKASGVGVSILWASEGVIYRRFGYGIATSTVEINLDRSRRDFAAPLDLEGTFASLSAEEALDTLPEIWDTARLQTPGFLSRSREWWSERRLSDGGVRGDSAAPLRRLLLTVDDHPAAYALVRQHPRWSEHFLPTGELRVEELVAVSEPAEAAMWQFVFALDLVENVRAVVAPDTQLLFRLADSRRLRMTTRDGLWLRVIDVQRALERPYASEIRVTFALEDVQCPWNSGVWAIDGSKGSVEQTTSRAELTISPPALASVYLGGFRFGQLRAGGLVVEHVPGAIARADALFSSARAPWCPEIF